MRRDGRRYQGTLCAPTLAMPVAAGQRGPGSAIPAQGRSHHRRPPVPSKSHTRGRFLWEQGDSVHGPRCHPALPSQGHPPHHAAAGVPVTLCSPASVGLCSQPRGTSCAGDGHRTLVSSRAVCTRACTHAHTHARPKTQTTPTLEQPFKICPVTGKGSKACREVCKKKKKEAKIPQNPKTPLLLTLRLSPGRGTQRGWGMRRNQGGVWPSPGRRVSRKGGYFGCFLFCFW